MYSIGVDIGKDDFYGAVVDGSCEVVGKARKFSYDEQGFGVFAAFVDGFVGGKELCLCIEACGVLHLNLVYWLREHRPEVTIYAVNPLVAKRFGGVTLRRNHTDPADAAHLAKLLVHGRAGLHAFAIDGDHRQLQRLVQERGRLTSDRVRETNRLSAALVLNFPEYKKVIKDVAGALSLELLARYPTASHVARTSVEQLASVRPGYKAAHCLGQKRAADLIALAQRTVGIGQSDVDAGVVRRLVEQLKQLWQQLASVEQQTAQLFAQVGSQQLHKQAQALQTIPGIGEVTAIALTARCGLIEAFDKADSLCAFVGTCPGRYQSGKSSDGAMLTPYGPSKLRAQLFMAVRNAKRNCPAINFLYHLFRQKGHKHRQALCACLNRVIAWCYAVGKSLSPFDLSRTYKNLLRHHEAQFRQFCREAGLEVDQLVNPQQPVAA